ncbi:MAG TPA: hypothetical protein VD838_14310, partial [Anaeromyxobacteraceae bacterium]|nr:hypothetical protein [Anaeromyxobacteraceae bacterium]
MRFVRRLTRGAVALALLLAPVAALAWKPYTHNYTASLVLQDVDLAGRTVLIGGQRYGIDPQLADAIAACPSCYNAGVIGPDGFPDLVFGQSVIHPVETGEWLRHILDEAWAAQTSGAYDEDEKKRILAFAHGYLTHAAGDMWAHTVVNEFAEGVFPGVGEILTSIDAASIAAKHLIVEGYIGDMTHGYDANPAHGVAPAGYDVHDGDRSDDSTPGFPYTAPHAFIFDTLISEHAATPIAATRGNYVSARGALIGGFLELRDALDDFVPDPLPNPLEEALAAYDDTLESLAALEEACDFDSIGDIIDCPAAVLEAGFDFIVDSAEAFATMVYTVMLDAAYLVLDAYLAAWMADIDAGLRHWSELGMATTRGLFDAQARRFLQNEDCQYEGDEGTLNRELCEEGVGSLDVVTDAADPFINEYGLSMIGLPDFVGDVRAAVQDVMGDLDAILGVIGLPFNPLDEAATQLTEWVKDLVVDEISETIGVDLEALNDFLHEPHRFVCLPEVSIDLPILGTSTLPLFDNVEQQRLMIYMGTTHVTPIPEPGLPPGCGRLPDWAEFDPAEFAPVANTITMAKLLLLTPAELNRLLTDTLGRRIDTYAAGENVMTKGIEDDPWLRMIDGDHAWRADGAPVFGGRSEELTAGKGTFPIWESCVLRPAFRSLFADWENPWDATTGHGPNPELVALLQFPEHGDLPREDLVNDPEAPASLLAVTGNVGTFVPANHALTLSAADGPVTKAFAPNELGIQRRVRGPAGDGPWLASAQGESFQLAGPDGTYFVDYHAEDPCHTFAPEGPGEPEAVKTASYTLDTTPPVTTCNTPPFGLTFDSDDFTTVDFDVTDGPIGSGVADVDATIDGKFFAPGPVTTTDGAALDLFTFGPGTRT